MKNVALAYGEGNISVTLPERADVLTGQNPPECRDPLHCIEESLLHPIGSPPLLELVKRKKPRNAAITISDITRPVPNRLFLPQLIDTLERGGVPKENVTIIIGAGMHRESTPAELRLLVGEEILRSCKVLDHRATDAEGLTLISDNPPLRVNKRFAMSDFKIVTGFIEPHFMAGFSGGRKGVCPALVDLRTIEEFHGYRALASENAREGVLDENPCHRLALSVAERVGVDFLFNVTIDKAHRLTNVFCGDLREAHNEGCEFLRTYVTRIIREPYDLVLTSAGGAPLDLNYYQSIKGMCTALPACKPGGTLVQVSSCREGVGSEAFRKYLQEYRGDFRRFIRDISSPGSVFCVDQWEVQMLCRVMAKIDAKGLWLFSDGLSEEDRKYVWSDTVRGGGRLENSLQDFVNAYISHHPAARIAVIPDGPYTVIAHRDAC